MEEKTCPLAKRCGACQYMGVPYKKQLQRKQEKIQQLFPKVKNIQPIIGMEEPYHYRCKVQATFGWQKGKIISGTYEAASHRLVAVENCLIEDQMADQILATIRNLMVSFKLIPYDEDHQKGIIRHVLIRKGHASGEILVVLVTPTPNFPGKHHFVKALCQAHPEIRTVIHNINGKKTSMILGNQQKTIMGPGYITDLLLGHTFRISASSFYQINPPQTEKLYAAALKMLQLTGTETLLDAYCGTGTIGILAAGQAASVIGVELNRQAVQDAVINAKINHISNTRFICEDAGRFLQKAAAQEAVPQVVIMDPPRGGSDEAFLSALAYASPERVVYISCNPETQARDLAYLAKYGYQIKEIQPVDLFPQTEHVETVVLLSHKSLDSIINVKVEFGEGAGKVSLDAIAERAKKYQPKPKITYKMIQEYVEIKYGFKVHTAYIAEVKRSLGLTMYDAPNAVEKLRQPRKHPPKEKVEAITDALKYFEVL